MANGWLFPVVAADGGAEIGVDVGVDKGADDSALTSAGLGSVVEKPNSPDTALPPVGGATLEPVALSVTEVVGCGDGEVPKAKPEELPSPAFRILRLTFSPATDELLAAALETPVPNGPGAPKTGAWRGNIGADSEGSEAELRRPREHQIGNKIFKPA